MNLAADISLARVEDRLRASVSGPGLLGAAARHLTSAPAKRARPRLLLAFARLFGRAEDERIVAAAAAVELIHTASLLHDDVVDEADERHAQPSVNARFGNGAAVLAGDVVLARALAMLAFEPRAVNAAVDAVARMSTAAVKEIEVRGRVDVALADALAIAEGKTGTLFGLCGTLAGLLAAPEHTTALETVGRAFGVAFQIADDIDDVATDVRERTPTVPLLLAAHDHGVRDALASAWRSDRDADAMVVRLVAPWLGDARALVDAQIARARAALAPFAGHDEILRLFSGVS